MSSPSLDASLHLGGGLSADDDERPNKRSKREPDDDEDEEDDEDDEAEEVIGPDGKKKVKGKGGSSCHQCKSRRNFTALTYCTSNLDKQKNKRCRKKFCGHCLKKFYKESAVPADKTTWKCPSCRKICCCAACRRRKNKESAKEEMALGGSSHHKVKKSSHKSGLHHAYDTGAHRARRDDDGMYHSSREDEGYPSSSSHRRSGDRSLLHGGSHLGGDDDYESESDGHMHDSDSDRGSDASDDDDDLSGEDGIPSHGQYAHMHDEDPSASLPSSQFTSLLAAHIKSLAEEAQRLPHSPFARLYAAAQGAKVKKKIKGILLRPDLKKSKKVELIAAILQHIEDDINMPPQQQQQQTQQQQQQTQALQQQNNPTPMQTGAHSSAGM